MRKIEKHILSKSTFLKGLQCPKALYLYKFHPELRDEITPEQQEIFRRGTMVGKIAQGLFQGGADASPETPFQYQESVLLTKKLMDEGATILYEAAFQFDRVLSAMDILVKDGGGWKAYEVKSSTEVSDVYLMDTALQYFVITRSGLPLEDIFLVHLNNQYVRRGEIDIHSLFTMKSLLNEVTERQGEVEREIERLKELLARKEEPSLDIGEHCFDPYDCDFLGHCWKHIPENSIFEISRLRKNKKFDLYRQGILRQEDVPAEYLKGNQLLQVECLKEGKAFEDRGGIAEFLDTLEYPLYFMDFETFMPAIPLYDNSRPYQQIPFQYSLHYLREPGGELQHFEFLGEAGRDPRRDFAACLMRDTAAPGDILVYNRAFEDPRLKELARDFPEFAPEIEERRGRIKDLMVPFQKKLLYRPEMKGSYSIKKVLPALIPELNYNHLEISHGGLAMAAYEALQEETDKAVIEKTRRNLLDYCKMDTFAMVELLRYLERFNK